VRLTLFTGLRAWRLYEVVRGDTVSAIARDQGQNATVADVFEADRDTLTEPNKILPGQVLRIPLL